MEGECEDENNIDKYAMALRPQKRTFMDGYLLGSIDPPRIASFMQHNNSKHGDSHTDQLLVLSEILKAHPFEYSEERIGTVIKDVLHILDNVRSNLPSPT